MGQNKKFDGRGHDVAVTAVVVAFVAISFIIAISVAISRYQKPLHYGVVVKREFIAAHTDIEVVPTMDSEGNMTTSVETTHVPDAWYITIEGANSDAAPIRRRRVEVDESFYEAAKLGHTVDTRGAER